MSNWNFHCLNLRLLPLGTDPLSEKSDPIFSVPSTVIWYLLKVFISHACYHLVL